MLRGLSLNNIGNAFPENTFTQGETPANLRLGDNMYPLTLLISRTFTDPGPFLTLLLTRICVRGLERDALQGAATSSVGQGLA